MILEKQTEAHILQEGESQDSVKMSLDLDSAQVLMQMLSKNLYSDAIGSTIRECASNALDSHRRAGTTDPIIVSYKRSNKSDTYEFAVEDFGIGLDADDVRNIISKYGKSTKRDSNTELGMMGLGFKAPLAYSSSFYFVARKDGMERKYMMYEGEDTNTIDLLYEVQTPMPNGVKVIVPVSYYDRHNFKRKIQEQLAYFESVYFDVDASIAGSVSNDFVIVRTEHFQFSSMATTGYMHLCLDNVSYPIDWEKLGIKNIALPIALRFSLSDGLFPTPNREAIRYTKEAKEVILKKLEMVANVFMEKYNESITDGDDPVAVLNSYRNRQKSIPTFFSPNADKNARVTIDDLLVYATTPVKKPKITGIEKLDLERVATKLPEYMFGEWKLKYRYQNGKFTEARGYWADFTYHMLAGERYGESGITYTFSEQLGVRKKNYLRSVLGHDHKIINFVKFDKAFKLEAYDDQAGYYTYYRMLDLGNYPKSEWRELIQEFQKLLKMFTDKFIDADAIEIPETWVLEQKAKRAKVSTASVSTGQKKVRLAGEISVKIASELQVWVNGQHCKFVPNTFKMDELYKHTKLTVYGTEEHREEMDKLYPTFKSQVRFGIVSNTSYNNLEKAELHNWINIHKFMEGKNKPFIRLVTSLIIARFMKDNSRVFERIERLAYVSEDLAKKMRSLLAYVSVNHVTRCSIEHEDTLISFAIENKFVDPEIYPTLIEVKNLLEKLPFLDVLCSHIPSYISNDTPREDKLNQMIADLFKYHKHKVNLSFYPKMNEDAPLEETLTQDTITELETI
jgi:hypothetical protein